MSRIEDQAWEIAEPFLKENGCVLWDVIFEKEGAMHYLKILFNDTDGSLDMEKCEKLTPPLNKLMDEQEFIKKGQVDILEIGSPGLSRRIRRKEHFDLCINNNKTVKIMKRLDNGKTETITGILKACDTKNKTITLDSQEIPLKKCIRITLEEQPQ